MSPLQPVVPRKSQTTITVVESSELTYYPITQSDIQVIIVLWVLFLVTSIFVGLRLYSRVKILQFYALEDYLYNLAFVSIYFGHFPKRPITTSCSRRVAFVQLQRLHGGNSRSSALPRIGREYSVILVLASRIHPAESGDQGALLNHTPGPPGGGGNICVVLYHQVARLTCARLDTPPSLQRHNNILLLPWTRLATPRRHDHRRRQTRRGL